MDQIAMSCPRTRGSLLFAAIVAILLGLVPGTADAGGHREQIIPVLGVTSTDPPTGMVVYVIVAVEERQDAGGLAVHFRNSPGRFSRMAQTAVEQAIRRAARSLGLSTDSWTVVLSFPYQGTTLYGVSLSAMVGLSAIALAQGRLIASDCVMTGTVTPDGHIGPVGSVPLKITAAGHAHVRRVVVPDQQDMSDRDWTTPFLMQVSPVGSVQQAYAALTAENDE